MMLNWKVVKRFERQQANDRYEVHCQRRRPEEWNVENNGQKIWTSSRKNRDTAVCQQ